MKTDALAEQTRCAPWVGDVRDAVVSHVGRHEKLPPGDIEN
jgi:hypothetical protein